MSFFSVIIPLYNKEKYILKTINSVLKQSYKDFELIIVNDGSTDESVLKLSTINDERISVITIKNNGASYARNYGVNKAKSKYIALLDADDYWYENHLDELKKAILKFPKAGLYCNSYTFTINKKNVKKAEFSSLPIDSKINLINFFDASYLHSVATSSSVAFSKNTFLKIGQFNLGFKSGQDTDLWIRFGLKTDVILNTSVTACYNNIVENSLSKRNFNTDRYAFINSYKNEEKLNTSLNKFLDLNRFALALRCKMNNEINLFKILKKEIEFSNLNFKQRIMLYFPKNILIKLKIFQDYLKHKNIYITAFK